MLSQNQVQALYEKRVVAYGRCCEIENSTAACLAAGYAYALGEVLGLDQETIDCDLDISLDRAVKH